MDAYWTGFRAPPQVLILTACPDIPDDLAGACQANGSIHSADCAQTFSHGTRREDEASIPKYFERATL